MFAEAIRHPSGQAGYRVHPADMEVVIADTLLRADLGPHHHDPPQH